MTTFLFIFGAAFGSFLNVVSLRYSPDKFLLGRQILGRSHCPHCKQELSWLELLPILSFLLQRGRCRRCGMRIGFQYPIVEILSGLIFVFVPAALISPISPIGLISPIFWISVFEALLLIALIDLRLKIIPDEANIFLAAIGAAMIPLKAGFWKFGGSFLGPYALIFGLRENIWLNHFAAALAGAAIFGFLILITRGRGMGMGDIKLAAPLGLVFGWPDIIFVAAFSFIIGSIAGAFQIVFRGMNLKSAIPFGPFLALGATTVFFRGEEILRFYFSLFSG